MITCLNLRALYGDRYRITFDQAYAPRNVPREKLDPWAMQLPCRFGCIFPHGGELVAVEVDYHAKVARALTTVPGVVLYQDGDHEKTFVFHVDLFDQVTATVKPYRRRQWAEEGRRNVAERLTDYQSRSVVDPRKRPSKRPSGNGLTPKPLRSVFCPHRAVNVNLERRHLMACYPRSRMEKPELPPSQGRKS